MNLQEILSRMTEDEKLSLCTGLDYWHTKPIERLGVPSFMMSDGPHGVRVQFSDCDMIGINESYPATCFPTAVTAGATFNRALIEEEGAAIAKEALAMGVGLLLGPGCNIKRDPLGGRNFEYFSEDPYVAGRMAAAFIRGQKREGAASCLKHFAVNNQEYKRQNGDSRVDMRTLREIYLAPFEIAVRESSPEAIMSSYNKINGVHASDDRRLLTELLRDEWQFTGSVITDWGGLSDRILALRAGCDLCMPGDEPYMRHATKRALKEGRLSVSDLDASVLRILELATRSRPYGGTVDFDAHHALAVRVAEEGAVLLKNEGGVLPLAEEDVGIIGYMAQATRYQGCGSSHINPTRSQNVRDVFPNAPFLAASDACGNVTDEALAEARALATRVKTPVLVIGLPESYESEGFDRAHMCLPEGYDRLVSAVADVNKNTVVVLVGGGVMTLPWADEVAAILFLGLAGQGCAEALKNLLTGKANPSGKLTESWPYRYEDTLSRMTFGKKDPEYLEGVYVGYRYYESASVPVRFPFGHGLSYTSFAYEDFCVSQKGVTLTVKNTGERAGSDVVEIFVAPPKTGVFRPHKMLCGFEKVFLRAGESSRVTIPIDEHAFSVYDGGWRCLGGEYTLLAGSSVKDIRLSQKITVVGEGLNTLPALKGSFYETCEGQPTRAEWELLMGHPVPESQAGCKGSFTMDSTLLEMAESSRLARLLCRVARSLVKRKYQGEKSEENPTYRMMMIGVCDSPLRAMVLCGGGRMREQWARALLAFVNGHTGEAIANLFRRF